MAYQRKTRDYWDIEGYYSHGWEAVCAAATWAEAKQTLREYRENEPGQFRAVKRRERIAPTDGANA